MNKSIAIFIILIIIAGIFIYVVNLEKNLDNSLDPDLVDKSLKVLDINQQEKTEDNNINNDVKTFVLTGVNFKFISNGIDNPDIVVNSGDKVRIEFTSTSGFHDWVVDEFDASTEKVSDGESTFIEFIADKTGIFEYYCSVGQHRANGMKGNLIVN